MKQSIPTGPVLSPVNGKAVVMNFDGAQMSSDAGLTLLREVERRHNLAAIWASCLADPRDPSKVRHSLEDIIRFWMMMIAAGYEDGNDATDLRHDPSFKMALERDPQTEAALCSQPTISRMECSTTLQNVRMATSRFTRCRLDLIDFPAVVAGGGRWVIFEMRNERRCRFCLSKAIPRARLRGCWGE